jgi:hypothetical protein
MADSVDVVTPSCRALVTHRALKAWHEAGGNASAAGRRSAGARLSLTSTQTSMQVTQVVPEAFVRIASP